LEVDIRSPIIYNLISYPKFDTTEYCKRINHLEKMGIKNVLLEGYTKLYDLKILGKGHAGIVLKVNTHCGDIVALKIRRLDSRRKNCLIEVRCQKLANLVGIGPRIIDSNDDLILMEYIVGSRISDWFIDQNNSLNITTQNIRQIVIELLEQCYRLDRVNLDHGELTRIDRHVMISDKNNVSIIDFESSSINRRPSNVTSVTQALFLSGSVSKKISQYVKISNQDQLIKCLKEYKNQKTRNLFEKILYKIN
jgi:putative serine/threonine protein kinase